MNLRAVQIQWNSYQTAHMNIILERDKYITVKSTPKIKITLNAVCDLRRVMAMRGANEKRKLMFFVCCNLVLFLACHFHGSQSRWLTIRPSAPSQRSPPFRYSLLRTLSRPPLPSSAPMKPEHAEYLIIPCYITFCQTIPHNSSLIPSSLRMHSLGFHISPSK